MPGRILDGSINKLINITFFNILSYLTTKVSKSLNFFLQVVYEITVVTGDTQYAGTDTNIFITVFGANGSTEEILLPKNDDR